MSTRLLAASVVLLAASFGAAGCGDVPTSTAALPRADPEPTSIGRSSAVQSVEAPPTLAQVVARGRYRRYETASGPLHVWTPSDYDATSARLVVYVHGYFTTVDSAWTAHRLPEQFAASGLNAMFVACEAPPGPRDPVNWPSLQTLLNTLQRAEDSALPAGDVVAIGHSAAYRTLDSWLTDPRLTTVVRFDAAYGDVDLYRAWLHQSASHKLVDLAEETKPWAAAVHRTTPGSVSLDAFPDDEPAVLQRARSVMIASSFGHFQMVSAGTAMPAILRNLDAR